LHFKNKFIAQEDGGGRRKDLSFLSRTLQTSWKTQDYGI